MRRSTWFWLRQIFALFFTLLPAQASVYSVTDSGKPLRWMGDKKLNLRGNPTNRSGLPSNTIFQAITRGLQNWVEGSRQGFSFDYWQGTNSREYSGGVSRNGVSTFGFASQQQDTYVSSNVIGLTQVWYNSNSGEILEIDLTLNDIHYQFSTDPSATTNGSASYSKKVFVDSVITHELGHAFGLSHSGSLPSTMLAYEFPEQSKISCDEQIAIQAAYQPQGQRGTLEGRVLDPRGVPVFGAHVTAISSARGAILTSAITQPDGSYLLDGLEEGTYFLLIEPYYSGSSSLPPYYASVSSLVCDGRSFHRSFVGGIRPRPVQVLTGVRRAVEDTYVSCSSISALTSNLTSVLSDTIQPRQEAQAAIISGSTEKAQIQINHEGGPLDLSVVGPSLFSSTSYEIKLLNSQGFEIPGSLQYPRWSGDSGVQNLDARLQFQYLASGIYRLEMIPKNVNPAWIPARSLMAEADGFALVVIQSSLPSLPQNSLPDVPRCVNSEHSGNYSSPSGAPPAANFSGSDESVGFCGSLQRQSSNKSRAVDSKLLGALVGWMLPWMLMALSTFVSWSRLSRKPTVSYS